MVEVQPDSLEGRLELDGRPLSLPLLSPLVLEPGRHRLTLHPTPADPLGPLSKSVELRPARAHLVTFDQDFRRVPGLEHTLVDAER